MEDIGWSNILLILNSGEGVPFRTEEGSEGVLQVILIAQEVRTHQGEQVKPKYFMSPNMIYTWNRARRGQRYGGWGSILMCKIRLGLNDPDDNKVLRLFFTKSIHLNTCK